MSDASKRLLEISDRLPIKVKSRKDIRKGLALMGEYSGLMQAAQDMAARAGKIRNDVVKLTRKIMEDEGVIEFDRRLIVEFMDGEIKWMHKGDELDYKDMDKEDEDVA
jgi:hypothetical protein